MPTRRAARFYPLLLLVAAISVWPCRAVARDGSPEGIVPPVRGHAAPATGTDRYVIHVSVDGLRADAVGRLGPGRAPNFYRLRIEGAYTDNARTDFDYTVTLPNHACELTGRPVLGPDGHGLSFNSDDGRTLEQIHGSYVAGVFDATHDNGLKTGMYVSKSKFAIFDRSWNGTNGASDVTGDDNGRDKIDAYVYDSNTDALVDAFLFDMNAAPNRYSFVHLTDPDAVGHSYGWESEEYFDSIIEIDGLLGRIFDLVDGDPRFSNKTYLVVTADHGGSGTDHADAANPEHYTVPLYVWGSGVPAGADLYLLNQSTRLDPAEGRPTYAAVPQPIRNGETANISLDLLGLDSVSGSTIDADQDCDAVLPEGEAGLPSISITSPPPGTSLPYPSSVAIEATADPGSGAIARVEFYENYVMLAADSTIPYACTWHEIPFGSYRLTARAVRADGIAATASVDFEITSTASAPIERSMLPPRVFPNPFGRVSTMEFFLARAGAVGIDVYDLLGRRIEAVFSGELPGGVHRVSLNADSYAPGVYFLRLRSGGAVRTEKLMVVR
jgi:hypothetical protein